MANRLGPTEARVIVDPMLEAAAGNAYREAVRRAAVKSADTATGQATEV